MTKVKCSKESVSQVMGIRPTREYVKLRKKDLEIASKYLMIPVFTPYCGRKEKLKGTSIMFKRIPKINEQQAIYAINEWRFEENLPLRKISKGRNGHIKVVFYKHIKPMILKNFDHFLSSHTLMSLATNKSVDLDEVYKHVEKKAIDSYCDTHKNTLVELL